MSIQTLFVVSDGHGRTGRQVVQAALVQFLGQRYDIVVRPKVRTREDARQVVQEAAAASGVIFYTLVSPDTRDVMLHEAGETPTVDLLGPTLGALGDLFRTEPRSKPDLLYQSDSASYDRFEAIEYALKHDDGQRPGGLADADVVLVGVSRSSKTSTCFYLAYQGIRAANVPLVFELPPPGELLALEPERVVGLRVNVMRLQRVREARARTMGSRYLDSYLSKEEIVNEIRYASALMTNQGWRSVDVSYRAIEEIGKEVIRLRGL
jgi:regulator of PEP synthase PpsR (kinase-PPPase family)